MVLPDMHSKRLKIAAIFHYAKERGTVMKNLKKLLALVLALMMILSLTPVFADESDTEPEKRTTGTITINGASASAIYNVYKIFTLNSFEGTSYSYTVEEEWKPFFSEGGEGAAYVSFHPNTWTVNSWLGSNDDAVVAEFAKKALAYAKGKIAPAYTNDETNTEVYDPDHYTFKTESSSAVFSDVALGYYLVDTSVGALCGLTNTDYDTVIKAKNVAPIVKKQVYEDSTNNPGKSNTADIGQQVTFQTTISVHAGADQYVLHDKMEDGFTFYETVDGVATMKYPKDFKVEHMHVETEEVHDIPTRMYTLTIDPECPSDCDFHIAFDNELYQEISVNDKILVTYSALLNRNAIIGGAGNKNETWIAFGDNGKHETAKDSTTTYTYFWDLVKVKGNYTPLAGAEFKLYYATVENNQTEYHPIYVKPSGTKDGDKTVYRHLTEDEKKDGETGVNIVITEEDKGVVRLVGFDNGTYYLEEVKEPEGYSRLTEKVSFTIADANLESVYTDKFAVGNGIIVVNLTGSVLPETGGMGTTLFYAVGAVLVLAAVVLLITKKRMSNEE